MSSGVKKSSLPGNAGKGDYSCCPPPPHTTPFPEENAILGVMYGVLLWADMNASTPPGNAGKGLSGKAQLIDVDIPKLHSRLKQKLVGAISLIILLI